MTAPEQMLKPCPFCGSDEHLSMQKVGSLTADMPDRPYRVVCTYIDHDTVTGPVAYGRLAAITAWNTRPAPAELVEALKNIADPISFMQRRAEAKGRRIDGIMANHLARDPEYLKEIARAALRNAGAAS